MKHNYEKSKFLEILRESPWISFASKKTGISRATIYRWMKDSPEFRREVNVAMKAGVSQIDEIAEMGLAKKLKEGYFPAIKFHLINNNPKYAPKRNIDPPPLFVHQHNDESEVCELCIRVAVEKENKEQEMKQRIKAEVTRLSNPKAKKEKDALMKSILKNARERNKRPRESWE
ncbi:MAG: AlpA family phage regulatory protein [Candidatus Pacebacteria bacterium]|nr:AlpA family phage regulatory protein [Candidatus Paceibacterota bacterium]